MQIVLFCAFSGTGLIQLRPDVSGRAMCWLGWPEASL
jgi:hypothetical protein